MSNFLRIGWRLIVIAVCAVFLLASVLALVSAVSDRLESRTWRQDMDTYEYELREGDYRGLGDRLASYMPEGEQFQLYWDVADAYECYSVYGFWQQVRQDPDVSPEDLAAAERYVEGYLAELQEIYKRSGDTAKKYIQSFAGASLP